MSTSLLGLAEPCNLFTGYLLFMWEQELQLGIFLSVFILTFFLALFSFSSLLLSFIYNLFWLWFLKYPKYSRHNAKLQLKKKKKPTESCYTFFMTWKSPETSWDSRDVHLNWWIDYSPPPPPPTSKSVSWKEKQLSGNMGHRNFTRRERRLHTCL